MSQAQALKEKITKEKAANYYREGLGNEKVDVQLAVVMFRKAADFDHPRAQAKLACLLWCGAPGVAKNTEEALRWAQKARRQAHMLTRPMKVYLAHFEAMRCEEIREGIVRDQQVAFRRIVGFVEERQHGGQSPVANYSDTTAALPTPPPKEKTPPKSQSPPMPPPKEKTPTKSQSLPTPPPKEKTPPKYQEPVGTGGYDDDILNHAYRGSPLTPPLPPAIPAFGERSLR